MPCDAAHIFDSQERKAVFETLTLPSLDILVLAARAVLLLGAFCVFALAFIRWRAADARANAQLLQQLERTFAEVRSLHESVAVMGARLEALGEKSEAETRLAPVNAAVSPRGYDIAARLAKNGADAEALIANCGLTRQEADLMVRLHGARTGTADATTQRSARVEQLPARTEPRTSAQQTTRTEPTESRTPTQRLPQIPVLRAPVQSPDTRAVGTRRRGSLVSMVG
jgi:hypothetical protein